MKGSSPSSWQPSWDLSIDLPFAAPNVSRTDLSFSSMSCLTAVQEETGLLDVFNTEVWFYADLDPEEQKRCAEALLPYTGSGGASALTNSAPEHAPTTYLFCSKDRAIRVDLQQSMVQEFLEAGFDFRKRECDAGHSPFLDRPSFVAKEISMAIQWSLSQH